MKNFLFCLAFLLAAQNLEATTLSFSTFLGGGNNDFGNSVTVNDNVVVCGNTKSNDFPVSAGAFDTTYNSNQDAFVTKLNSSGTALIFSTFLGGSEFEESHKVSIRKNGDIFVIGSTWSVDFPVTPNAFDTTFNIPLNNFVTKLNSLGNMLVYSTFTINSLNEVNTAASAISDSGSVLVTGTISYLGFPTTAGAYDVTMNGEWDTFLSKLNHSGTAIVFSTFFGGSENDIGRAIVVSKNEDIYFAGSTWSSDFPITSNAYDTSFNGGLVDCFVTQFNSSGNSLVFSTFLGGSLGEENKSLAVADSGSVFFTGSTASSNFPITSGAYDSSLNGIGDVFVSRLNAAGTALNYSTFLGGSGMLQDVGTSVCVDKNEDVFLTGFTWSSDFPTTSGAFSTTFNGGFSDVFLSKLSTTGSVLDYSTFLGGGGGVDEGGKSVLLDGNGNIYLTGYTKSANFPTTSNAFDTSQNGNEDIFVTKFNALPTELGEKNNFSLSDFVLEQNYPNPFNPTTSINYFFPAGEKGALTIFNTLGQRIKEFELKESKGNISWDGTNEMGNSVSSGVYFYQLKTDKLTQTKSMTLIK